tara:strand:+ start:2196 stop:3650 length:1455 start_codon:yes stop_codon:yes gene_type:complete
VNILPATPAQHPFADPDRRRFLKSVSAGAMGIGLADLLALEAVAKKVKTDAPAKQVLVVYEEGGISQMDSWDPKPDAPLHLRSPFKSIPTSVPGTHFSALMPRTARLAHKLSVVRSMTNTTASPSHPGGCQEFLKGCAFNDAEAWPDIGSIVTELTGSDCPQLPGYIFCPGANMPNAKTTTGFLPAHRAPWKLGTKSLGENVAAPDWKVHSLEPVDGLSAERLDERSRLLDKLDRSHSAQTAFGQLLRKYGENALELLLSPQVQAAFDLTTEKQRTRDRYGRDHRGCCYLMGRKLIEAGVRFVTVTVIQPPDLVGRPNYGKPNGVFLNWDHHEGIYTNGPCGGPQGMNNQERYGLPHPVMMPSLDRSLSALIEDMDERGLLDETLVCFITEMGRTPTINEWGGRDHWGRAMSIAFAGAGCPGGAVIGATTRDAGDVTDRLYTPMDYAETIYRKLGINSHQALQKPNAVAVNLTEGGNPIRELFA